MCRINYLSRLKILREFTRRDITHHLQIENNLGIFIIYREDMANLEEYLSARAAVN